MFLSNIKFFNTSFQESIRRGDNDFLAWKCKPSDIKKNGLSCPYDEGPLVPMGEYVTSAGYPEGMYYLRAYGNAMNMTCNDESCFA